LLVMRILANSVSGWAAESAVTLADRIGGHGRSRDGSCVRVVIFARTVGSGPVKAISPKWPRA